MPEAVLQVVIAALLGALIGLQREVAKKAAGMRTYAFVAIGSCLFTIISRVGPRLVTHCRQRP